MPQADESWSRRPIRGGVLIGGGSRRMGRPKPLVSLDGATFIERVVNALSARLEQVVLLGQGPVPTSLNGMMRIPDAPGLVGPLAGILAALRWAPGACWVVIACDLPLLRAEAVDWLLAQRAPDRWAVLPRLTPQRVEPLLAVYEPESRALLEELTAAGIDSPHSLAGRPHVHCPSPPESLRCCWTNINTPEELRAVQEPSDGAARGCM